MKRNNSKKLGDVIKNVTNKKPIRKKLEFVAVQSAWKRVIGPNLQQYVKRVFFKDEILHVTIHSGPMKQELQFSRDLLLQKMKKECPQVEINEIKIL